MHTFLIYCKISVSCKSLWSCNHVFGGVYSLQDVTLQSLVDRLRAMEDASLAVNFIQL